MSRYNKISVLVVGDLMIDHSKICKPKRISQEAPVIVVKKQKEQNTLGGAGNIIYNLKTLGANVTAAGVIGDDYFGEIMTDIFDGLEVDYSSVVTIDRPTTVKTRIFVKDRQLIRIDSECVDSINREIELAILDKLRGGTFDIICVPDYDKGVVTSSLIMGLKKFNIPIVVNCKPENILHYKGIDTLICNDYEYHKALDNITSKYLTNPNQDDLIDYINCNNLLHTQGDKGLHLYTKNKYYNYFIPAEKVIEVDCTGASDTVTSVICLELLKSNIYKASILANYAASIIVSKLGTVPVYYSELEEKIKEVEKGNY